MVHLAKSASRWEESSRGRDWWKRNFFHQKFLRQLWVDQLDFVIRIWVYILVCMTRWVHKDSQEQNQYCICTWWEVFSTVPASVLKLEPVSIFFWAGFIFIHKEHLKCILETCAENLPPLMMLSLMSTNFVIPPYSQIYVPSYWSSISKMVSRMPCPVMYSTYTECPAPKSPRTVMDIEIFRFIWSDLKFPIFI